MIILMNAIVLFGISMQLEVKDYLKDNNGPDVDDNDEDHVDDDGDAHVGDGDDVPGEGKQYSHVYSDTKVFKTR